MEQVKNIFKILVGSERKKLHRLIWLDVTVSVLDVFFLAVLLFVIKFYSEPSTSYIPQVFHQYPLLIITIFFILFSAKNFFAFFVFKSRSKFTYGVASRLSKDKLENYFNSSYAHYVNTDSSVHTRKISQEPIEFGYYILTSFQQIVGQAILICITITAILIYNPVLFPLLITVLAPPVIICGLLQKKRLAYIRKHAETISRKNYQHLQEALSGFVESNFNYGGKTFFLNRYHQAQTAFNNSLSTQQVVQNLPSRFIEVFAVFGLFVLILLHNITASGDIQLFTIGAFMAAAYKIIPGIVKIVNSLGQMKTYAFTVHNMLKDIPVVPANTGAGNFHIRDIAFKNVSFGYNNHPLIKDFSFAIKTGDFVGLSAPSGNGKTTLINLLLGFLEPLSGEIAINGERIENLNTSSLRFKISYIKQQSFFIHDTAIKNIVLTDDGYDEQRLETANNISGLNGIASKLITENGKNISGGQRQRVSMARALYKDADLIILDEPFNELDRESENSMLLHCKALAAEGKIIILVTHDKESLSYCNKIISLDGN